MAKAKKNETAEVAPVEVASTGEFLDVSPLTITKNVGIETGRFSPPNDEDVNRLAYSLVTDGQKQAVQCRRLDDGTLKPVFGNTRHEAACRIVNGFTYQNKEYKPNPGFRLKVEVVKVSDADAATAAFVENIVRSEPTYIDIGAMANHLKDTHGQSLAVIGRRLGGVDKGYLSKCMKCASTLPPAALQAAQQGKLSRLSAEAIIENELSEDEVNKLIGEHSPLLVVHVEEYVKSRTVSEDTATSDGTEEGDGEGSGEGEGTPAADKPKKTKARKDKEVFAVLNEFSENGPSDEDQHPVQLVVKAILRFKAGNKNISDKFLYKLMEKIKPA